MKLFLNLKVELYFIDLGNKEDYYKEKRMITIFN